MDEKRKALRAAFPHTLPILAGFLFLGFSYGVYMNVSGFSFWYPLLMSLTIFGGSLEFVAVTMLLGSFAPLETFLVTLLIQARHLFYGISMIRKYTAKGLKKFYLIFGLCDETFSINYTLEPPEGVDRDWFMVFVTALNQLYWVTGATLGGIFGSFFPFNTEGLSFVMTALFVVIFLEEWLKEKQHITALIGVVSSAVALFFFGAESFLIPAMIIMLCFLTVFRKPITRKGEFS